MTSFRECFLCRTHRECCRTGQTMPGVLPQFCRSYYLAGIEEINDFPNTLPSSLTLQAYIALNQALCFKLWRLLYQHC
ncbi:hypothetical protein PUATCC27989T_01428 [Phytobacter ursingii]|nr:hypothetical protein PUATCC27989T_01428 [Phytobacter ursingii]